MASTPARILKSAVPVGVILGVTGYVYAQVATTFIPATPEGQQAAAQLAFRVPAVMGLTGFLFVAGFELLASIWRGQVEIEPTQQAANHTDFATESGLDPEVEKLLNTILAREAALETPGQIQQEAVPEEVAVAHQR